MADPGGHQEVQQGQQGREQRIARLCERLRARAVAWCARDPEFHVAHFGEHHRQWVHRMYLPPATEEQVQATEAALGFALPATLRRLYLEVANGGMALRDIVGVSGGRTFDETGGQVDDPSQSYTLGEGDLVSHRSWRLDERVAAALARAPETYVLCAYDERPDRFISLQDEGCAITVEMDGWSGRLYTTHSYGPARTRDGRGHWLKRLRFEASSIEEWLEAWLDLAPYPPALPIAEPTYVPLTPDLLAPPLPVGIVAPLRAAILTERTPEEDLAFEDGAWRWYQQLDHWRLGA